MKHEQSPVRRKPWQTVRIHGRSYPVRGKERIRGRLYLLVRHLAPTPRERWLVYDTAARSPRVLLILPGDDSTRQQVRVLRTIENRSLPRIVDIDWGEDRTLVVVPWIPGIDVDEYLCRIRAGKVAPPEPFHAIRLILELARALRSLHVHAQVSHGDIKPANLILTRKSSHISLIDFGSSWSLGRTGFRFESEGASPVFAAPEMAGGSGPDERADQFSATVILYLLLTGTVPFDGLGGKAGWPTWNDDSTCLVPPSQTPFSRRYTAGKLWKQIDAVVEKSLELDPGRRFVHSDAWVDALEDVFLQLRLARSPSTRRKPFQRALDWIGSRFEGIPRGGQSHE